MTVEINTTPTIYTIIIHYWVLKSSIEYWLYVESIEIIISDLFRKGKIHSIRLLYQINLNYFNRSIVLHCNLNPIYSNRMNQKIITKGNVKLCFTFSCIIIVAIMIGYWLYKFEIEDRDIGVVDFVPLDEGTNRYQSTFRDSLLYWSFCRWKIQKSNTKHQRRLLPRIFEGEFLWSKATKSWL